MNVYLNDTATTAEIDDRAMLSPVVTGADTTYLKDSQIVLRLATRGSFVLLESGDVLFTETVAPILVDDSLVASGDLIEVKI